MKRTIKHLDKTFEINLHENEVVSSIINQTNSFFESAFLEYVRINYNNQNVILDIGANIGNHALFFSEFLQHKDLICFEPFQQNVDLINKNLIGRKYQMMNYALSDSNSQMPLYNSQSDNYGGFSLHCYDGSKGENKSFLINEVTTKTLDSLNLEDVSMIKIDVEGHENNVFNGAIKTIQKNNPIIFIENLYHGYPHLFNESQFNDFFNNVGYILEKKNIENSFIDLWIKA